MWSGGWRSRWFGSGRRWGLGCGCCCWRCVGLAAWVWLGELRALRKGVAGGCVARSRRLATRAVTGCLPCRGRGLCFGDIAVGRGGLAPGPSAWGIRRRNRLRRIRRE